MTPGAPAATPVLLATGNAHKLDEVRAILGLGWALDGHDPEVAETGTTFEENALIKARAVAAATGRLALADDSGIALDALDGAPGIHSARWTAEGDWIPKVLRSLAAVEAGGGGDAGPGGDAAAGDGGRGCRYVAAAAAVWPDGREMVVRGTVEGRVAREPRGSGGFGYDSIMVPVEGDGRTFAEMTDAEKHALSHRGRAFRALAPHLGPG